MEVETVGRSAVEVVALDGAVKTFWMGTVDTELMSAACLGIEGNKIVVNELIASDGLLAVLMIHHLARTVERIG